MALNENCFYVGYKPYNVLLLYYSFSSSSEIRFSIIDKLGGWHEEPTSPYRLPEKLLFGAFTSSLISS
jgi:hypothetical protein